MTLLGRQYVELRGRGGVVDELRTGIWVANGFDSGFGWDPTAPCDIRELMHQQLAVSITFESLRYEVIGEKDERVWAETEERRSGVGKEL